MPQVKDNHPSAEQLEAYGLGRLDPTQQESLDKHVAGCAACCKKLETLGPDALVALLQSARQTASALDGAETLIGRDKPDAAPPGPADAGVPAELRDHARFHVLGMLGAGGMGSVYKAEHRLMERMVALKIISKRILDNPAAIERFQREVKAAAKLSHPNIVAAYDAEKLGDTHMLVMEYVKGQSLAEYVERKGPLPVTYACHFIRQAALGLQHAHELGMVHRDLKPQNLMLTPKGAVKILDFGLARMVSETAQGGGLTQENALMGTPDFIAPEQATDARTADIRSDIYSLGCTLYYLLTAQPPFPEGTAIQKVLAHLERKPKSVSELRKEMPAQVVAILDRMLAKDPAQRYQTPAQVVQALTPFARLNAAPMESEVVAKPAPVRTKPRAESQPLVRPRRDRTKPTLNSRLLVAVGAGTVALLILVAVIVVRFAGPGGEGVLIIETVDPDVEVIVRQRGKEVAILDKRARQEVKLPVGVYQFELGGKKKGFRLETRQYSLNSGDREVVRVTWEENQPIALSQKPAAKAEVPSKKPTSTPDEPMAQPPPKFPFSGREVMTLKGHTGTVWSVVFSPDGKQIASGGGDMTEKVRKGKVRIWDAATGESVRTLHGHTGPVRSVGYSPKGDRIVSGAGDLTPTGRDGTVKIWDAATGNELQNRKADSASITTVAYSPAGQRIIIGGDKSLKIWNPSTDQVPVGIYLRTSYANSAAIHPDGNRIVTGSSELDVWEAGTGRKIFTLDDHTSHVNCVAYSPHGTRIVSGSFDTTLRVWDAATGHCIHTLQGHTASVSAVAFSPDNKRIVSGSYDKTLKVWDAASGQDILTLRGHTGAVLSVAFSPDGKSIVSGSDDQTAKVWEISATTAANE